MAMIIVVAMIIAAMSLWLYRAEKLVVRYLDYKKPPEPLPPVDYSGMPDDLIVHANTYGTDWARQQTLDAMNELYGKLQDWQKVRTAMGFSSGTI